MAHRIAFLLILLAVRTPFGQPALPTLQKGVELSLQHQYDHALALFQTVIDSFPTHPAGPLLMAAVYQSMMLDMESERWREPFAQSIAQALALAQARPQESWFRFYHGAALSYKSYQQAREKKYLAALPTALSSMRDFNRLLQEDSTFCEPMLGIGNYLYWRSKLARWLPFLPRQKEQGVQLIEQAYRCSQLSKWAALSSLCWISMEEKRYDQARTYSEEGLRAFPQSRFFLWPWAEALFRSGRFVEAEKAFTRLNGCKTGILEDNGYNQVVIFWKLAQCAEHNGEAGNVVLYCRQALAVVVRPEVKDRAAKKLAYCRQLLSKYVAH